ncbi:hypothetical protein HYW44_00205 [Candidatus Daviesbacteria bacterium]|nr:hypothetical protein [Candidatus Daviesbacteria bacterium]
MKNIQRNTTTVMSVSLPRNAINNMEEVRKSTGQSRSAFIASLIQKAAEDKRLERIYKRGEKTAKDFKITSEDDIDRILHEP